MKNKRLQKISLIAAAALILLIALVLWNMLPASKEPPQTWQEFMQTHSWELNGTCVVNASDYQQELEGMQAQGSLLYDLEQDSYLLNCSFSYRNASLLSIYCYIDKDEIMVKIPSLSTGVFKGNTMDLFSELINGQNVTDVFPETLAFFEILERIKKLDFFEILEMQEGYRGVDISINLDETVSFQLYWKGYESEQYSYILEDAYVVWNDTTLFHLSGACDLEVLRTKLQKPTGTVYEFWDLLDLWR